MLCAGKISINVQAQKLLKERWWNWHLELLLRLEFRDWWSTKLDDDDVNVLEVMDEDIVSDGSTEDEGVFVESIDSITMSSFFLSNYDVYKTLLLLLGQQQSRQWHEEEAMTHSLTCLMFTKTSHFKSKTGTKTLFQFVDAIWSIVEKRREKTDVQFAWEFLFSDS